MANAYTTTAAGAANSIAQYYSKVFLERLTPGPIMMNYVYVKDVPLNSGKLLCQAIKQLVCKNFTICWKLLKPLLLTLEKCKGYNNG